ADRQLGFDIEQAPLMRVALTQLADDRWHVLWTSHHLVLDGWSMPIVINDVMAAYFAFRRGQVAWTERPAARFADYIAWLQRQASSRAEVFWRRTLDRVRPTIAATPPRPAGEGPRVEREALRFEIPQSLFDRLHRLGGSGGITMNTWCAGAWGVLLAQC